MLGLNTNLQIPASICRAGHDKSPTTLISCIVHRKGVLSTFICAWQYSLVLVVIFCVLVGSLCFCGVEALFPLSMQALPRGGLGRPGRCQCTPGSRNFSSLSKKQLHRAYRQRRFQNTKTTAQASEVTCISLVVESVPHTQHCMYAAVHAEAVSMTFIKRDLRAAVARQN